MIDQTEILRGFAFYAVFLVSTVLHEAAHAWAAKRGGDLTAYRGGQVSLDPRPHIRRERFGMVILPIISVLLSGWPLGFASVPYDARWAMRFPKRAALMSLAGPAANLLLLLGAALTIRLGMLAGVFGPPAGVAFGAIVQGVGPFHVVGVTLGMFFSMNLLLFVFNMLPVPPLDGSGAIPLLLSPNTTRRYQELMRRPMLGLIGIVIAWQLFQGLFWPVFMASINLLYFPHASYLVN